MEDSPRIEDLQRRVRADPDSLAFAPLAEEYRRAGRFEEAIAACQTGLARHPAYLSARVTLGRSLIEVGRLADARRELETVLESAPANLAATTGLKEISAREASGQSSPRPVRPVHAELTELERFQAAIRAARASAGLR